MAVKSYSKKAKSLIRGEIKSYFGPSHTGENMTSLKAMKRQADSHNGGYPSNYRYVSDYKKAVSLVDGGCFACYYSDQRKLLNKIYGKKKVDTWSGDKIHGTYAHLIGREYDSMLREKERRSKKKIK